MRPDSVLNFVAQRRQSRQTDQPASAQHLKLPVPRTTPHQSSSLGIYDQRRVGCAPKIALGDAVTPFVNQSRQRPKQAPASHGDVFDTDVEDLDDSLTTSLIDATFPRQSPNGDPPSGPAAQDGRAMAEYERARRVQQILPTLHRPGVQSREADNEAYTNSSSDGEPQQASNVSYSSNHESQNGMSRILPSSSPSGPTTMSTKIRPVPIQHSERILQSNGLIRTGGPSVHEYSRNGPASPVSSPACSTSGEPADQEDQLSEHDLTTDRASLQSSRFGSPGQAGLLKLQQTEVQPYVKHSRELDYTRDELSRMNYSRLKGESFDLIPGEVAGPAELFSPAELVNSLEQIFSNQRHGQEGTQGRAFFATLSIDQYEECGDLIIEAFKDILDKFKVARRQKRLLAWKFEEKVQQRQYIIGTKQCAIEKDLKTMRHNGSGLIPCSHSQKLHQG